MPSFCRHNRFIQNCPICREPEPERRVPRSSSSGTRSTASRPSTSSSRARSSGSRSSGGVRVRQLARAVDDGYRSGLVPGLKASADAERLADEIAFAATRLAQLATDPPGTYAEAALEADREEGLWLAFLTAVVCPEEGEDPFAGVRAAHVRLGERRAARPLRRAAGPAVLRRRAHAHRVPRVGRASRLSAGRAGR